MLSRACFRIMLLIGCLTMPALAIRAATVADIVESCQPSVVQILVLDKLGQVKGSGSGFVIAPELVATCYHVIDGAMDAQVKTTDRIIFPVTSVVAYDPLHDLAILRVKKLGLAPLPLANSDDVKAGEEAIALGSPLGLEGAAVTNGIVSAKREHRIRGPVIQVSTPVSPGNSGGPLLNKDAQVIGIVSFGLTDGQNLNFGIAVNSLRVLREDPEQKECTLSELYQQVLTDNSPTGKKPIYGYTQPCEAQTEARIPKKGAFTVAPFGYLDIDLDSVKVFGVTTRRGKVTLTPFLRVTEEKNIPPLAFFVAPSGTLRFSSRDADTAIQVRFTYRPQRVAILVPREEEKVEASECIAQIIETAGYEPVTGAEVQAVYAKLVNADECDYLTLAQELDCSYFIMCSYSFQWSETGWYKSGYTQWEITAQVNLVMHNLNTGSKPIDSSQKLLGAVGKLAKVDHYRQSLVRSCLLDILGSRVVVRKDE